VNADRIVRQDNGQYGYRSFQNNYHWAGTLETNPANMEPARAYWYANKSGTTRSLIIAGEADITAAGIPAVTIAAPTAPSTSRNTSYAWRDPRSRPRNQLNPVAQADGSIFSYNGSSWSGTLTTVTPGQAYWIINRNVTPTTLRARRSAAML
jgi:hypothetical protein